MSTEDIPESEALFGHLTKVLLKIVRDRPDDAFNAFESMSSTVKAEVQTAAAAALLNEEDTTTDADISALKEKQLFALQESLNLIKAPKKPKVIGEDEEEEEEEEEEEKENVPIPDILAQHAILNRIGVNLGSEEAYKLALSLQKLANKNELSECKFWGKIHGTAKDYYVVEGKLEEYPEEEEPEAGVEPLGTGANEYIYFVTNSLQSQEWTKLPVILPHQIKVARQVNRFFTGDLKASVLGFPRFPWGESVYLRAQIARICHSTSVMPKGVYTIDPEDEEAVPELNEEYKAQHVLLMDQAKNWVHARQGLLMVGRTTQAAVEEEEEEEDEGENKPPKTEEQLEKPPKRLLSIEEDLLADQAPCWSLAVLPNPMDQFAAVCLSSNVWPGARTALIGTETVSCYIGWGHKYSLAPYSPPTPPSFAEEYQNPFDNKEVAIDPLGEQEDEQPPKDWTLPPVDETLPESEGDDDDDGTEVKPAEEGGGDDE